MNAPAPSLAPAPAPLPADLALPGRFSRVWTTWLGRVRDTLHGHGAELVDALGAAGVTDNVARAERVLRHACEAGWLERGANRPTREQVFFDVNGDNARTGWVTSGYAPGPRAGEAEP